MDPEQLRTEMRLSWSNLWKNQVQGYQTSACTTLECEGWPDGTLLASSTNLAMKQSGHWRKNRGLQSKWCIYTQGRAWDTNVDSTHTYIYIYIYLSLFFSRCQSYQVPILSVSFKLGDWRLLSWRVMVPWANTPQSVSFSSRDDPVPGCLRLSLAYRKSTTRLFRRGHVDRFPQGEASNFSTDLQPLWGSTLGPRGP